MRRAEQFKQGPWQVPRIVESRLCRGCDKPCGDREYCSDCGEYVGTLEVEFLEKTYGDKVGILTPAEKIQRGLLAARMKCGQLLWVPELVLVAGAAVYIGWVFAAAVLAWLEAGGVR